MPNSSFLNHTRRVSSILRPLLPRHLPPPSLNSSSSASVVSKRIRISNSNSFPYFYHQNLGYGSVSCNVNALDPEHQCDAKSSTQVGDAEYGKIKEWKSRFKMLMQNENEEEVMSKEKSDRRNFKDISAVASEMGLYSHQYERTVVFSKVPLPTYRPDLDDRRPQRVVDLDPVVQERVEYHLKEYLYSKSGNARCTDQVVNQVNGMKIGERLQDWQGDLFGFTRRILNKKNLELHKRQQDWQQCHQGQKMMEFRKSLPSHKQRETLLKAVSQNQVVVISGETGCGKTTQLPQYILESEIEAGRGAACNIICTQPRRISAISVSERVSAERGDILGGTVGYKVRLEGMRSKETRLLFCTTGILLRRLLNDRELEGVSHIIVDEIHERGINEDFLLIVLKDLLPRKPGLRVVLMSATLNADLFSSYFGKAPMIHIPGFTFPVQTYFLENYLELAGYRLTPSNQIDNYGNNKWKTQRQTLKKRTTQIGKFVEDSLKAADFTEFNRETQESLSCWNPDSIGFNLIENVLCHICENENPGAVLVFLTGWDDIQTLKRQLNGHSILGDPSRVLLLACHGSMSSQEQKLIFNRPKEGIRKIVLSTNMAETSITINDVVFVVDCGKAKESSYDALNNIPCLLPSWISQASAKQRRGRAGRVQAGVCYHLYPKCVHDAFPEYQLPEILRTPLHSLCLQIKTLQLASIFEFLNKALQPPEPLSVNNAIEYLKTIGAFDENENLTMLGHRLAMIPVEPKLGKMLVYGAIFNCLDPILTVVAGLSDRNPFELQVDKKGDAAKLEFSAHDFSDHLALVKAYDGWKAAERTQSSYQYCKSNALSFVTLRAIDSLRQQFIDVLMDIGVVDDVGTCNMWSQDYDLICSIICAGLFPGICSVVNNDKRVSFKSMEDGLVLLSPASVNYVPPEIPQPWIVFNEKVKVTSVYIRDATAVSDSMVLLFGGSISAARLNKKYGLLTMLGGYFEFFTRRSLADTYLILKRELDEFIQMKLVNPNMGIGNYRELLLAVRFLVREDQSNRKSVFDYEPEKDLLAIGGGDNNSKTELQTVLARAGHQPPIYTTMKTKHNNFISLVRFNGFSFTGQPCSNEKESEKSAACKALVWLTGEGQSWEKTSGRRTLLQAASTTRSDDLGVRQIVGLWDGIEEEANKSQNIFTEEYE